MITQMIITVNSRLDMPNNYGLVAVIMMEKIDLSLYSSKIIEECMQHIILLTLHLIIAIKIKFNYY